MNVKKNNGHILIINIENYLDSNQEKEIRDSLFSTAAIDSQISPLQRVDIFDESILTFESILQALQFSVCVLRQTYNEGSRHSLLSLRSGICSGDIYFFKDEIYGSAVNFATQLSSTSRINELLISGTDKDISIIKDFIITQLDASLSVRDQQAKSYSIRLTDPDETSIEFNDLILKIQWHNQKRQMSASRFKEITIGRSSKSDLPIDNFHISRNHATITFNDNKISIEDHSANGTYIYVDGEEKFISNSKISLTGNGYILCGQPIAKSDSTDDTLDNKIFFEAQIKKELKCVSAKEKSKTPQV